MITGVVGSPRAWGHVMADIPAAAMAFPQVEDCVTPEFLEIAVRLLQEDLAHLSPEQKGDVARHNVGVRCDATASERALLDLPPSSALLGLWVKAPATVIIYEKNIRERARLERLSLEAAIRDTLRHEIGHALGVLIHNGKTQWLQRLWADQAAQARAQTYPGSGG